MAKELMLNLSQGQGLDCQDKDLVPRGQRPNWHRM